MLQSILFIYLAYRNSITAKLKGQNALISALATLAAIMFCMVMGGMFVTFAFCKDAVNLVGISSFDVLQRQAAAQQLREAISGDTLHLFTISWFALGGYMIIRRLLERLPDEKKLKPDLANNNKLGKL